jgi:hypothetical protein
MGLLEISLICFYIFNKREDFSKGGKYLISFYV